MSRWTLRFVVGGFIAAVVIVGALLVGSHLSIGRGGLGNMASSGADLGGGGSDSPTVTSIILDVSGTTGDIHVLSATVSTSTTLTVSTSDPNYGTLLRLSQLTAQGDMADAVRTMYLHYSYSDGSTKQYTLNQAYVSALSTSSLFSSGSGTGTATIKAQSVSSS